MVKAVKQAVKKPAGKAKPKAVKKAEAYECGVCGYRLVANTECGCIEEHVIICCHKPMKKK